MIRPADQPLSARDVCRILFRHRRKSLLLFVTVVGLAVAGILLMPRKYASEAKLYVKLSLRLDPTATDEGQILAMTPEREEEMRSVVALLGSRSLYEQVVDQLGAATVLETKLQTSPLDLAMHYALSTLPQLGAEDTKAVREKAIRHLVKTIRIDNPKKSHVINLEYKSRSATLAQQVLDAYVRACLRLHLDIIKNPGAYQFFVQQEELLREQVLAAKQELRDLKNQVGLVSVDGQRQVLNNTSSASTVRSCLRRRLSPRPMTGSSNYGRSSPRSCARLVPRAPCRTSRSMTCGTNSIPWRSGIVTSWPATTLIIRKSWPCVSKWSKRIMCWAASNCCSRSPMPRHSALG